MLFRMRSLLLMAVCSVLAVGQADVAKTVVKVEPLERGADADVDASQLSKSTELLKTELLKSGRFVIYGDSENQQPDLCVRGTVLSCQSEPIAAVVGGYSYTAFSASCEIRMTFLNGLSHQEVASDTFVGKCDVRARRLPSAALPQARRSAQESAIADAMDKVAKFIGEQRQFNAAPSLAGVEVILLEEAPTQGQLKMASAFGSGLDGQKFFLANYGVMQRKIRDLLALRLSEAGADVKLLEDNEAYAAFKTKDGSLVGVYFDPETNEFAIDNDLIDEVKASSQKAVVVYYRIDTMTYDEKVSKLYVGASLNLRNFASNLREPYATLPTVEIPVATTSREVMMDKIATETAALFDRIWKLNGKGQKVADLATKIRDAGKGRPLTLQINARVFDVKTRKRALYAFKKKLIERKLCTSENVESNNNSLHATISNPDIPDAETLYMEHIAPLFVEMGLELSDDQVNYSGREVLVKPGLEEAK